jgi:hypothetical protein
MTIATTDRTVHGLRLVHSVFEHDAPARGRGANDVDTVRLHFALRDQYDVRSPMKAEWRSTVCH